ncbi:MAG: TolC family protein [Gemmatimonadetes bacterium]|nr:TolC family protein [Gemmatimonadota bacterium]
MLAASPVRTQQVSPREPIVGVVDSLLATVLPVGLRAGVLARAPEVTTLRAEVTAAERRRDALGFAPPATATVATEDARGGRADRGTTRLDISWDLLSAGRRQGARAVGEADVLAARAVLDGAHLQALADAVRALYGGAGARIVARRLAMQDTLLADAESSLAVRFASGDARYVDVLRLRTERLRVQGNRVQATAGADAAATALAALLGSDSAAVEQAAASFSSAEGVLDASDTTRLEGSRLPAVPALDALLAASPQLQLASAQRRRAITAQQLTRAQQRPAPTIGLGLQRIGADVERAPAFGPALAFGLTLPFTAAPANRAASAAAAEDVVASEAAERASIVTVRAGLSSARTRYDAARVRLTSFDRALLRAARDEREGALAAYRNAQLSLVEFLDFERALVEAESSRIQATVDALDALADLIEGLAAPASLVTRSRTPRTILGDPR